MRSQVEKDFARREERQLLDETQESREVRYALRAQRQADKNDHVTAYLTPDYIKSIYTKEGDHYMSDVITVMHA